MTTTWSNKIKTLIQHFLARENDDNILRENGDFLLLEDDKNWWTGNTKNSTTWSQPIKNNTTWATPTKN